MDNRRNAGGGGFKLEQEVARTAGFAVRVFSVAIVATVPYSTVRQPTDGLIVDRVRMPSDARARIASLHQGAEKTRTTKPVVRATHSQEGRRVRQKIQDASR